ncbi:MAG TPA: tyrosine-type recombinase/integrase [Tepidisphaeraceae bacterium]|jgi:integrase|nr:tyrosine-type recombinase/integrase [Tepidisphaeraceae bacterium]
MVKSKSNRGRPVAVHRPKIGDPVVGLMKLGDGRWRASGPEKYTFTELDEGLAIAHFREWQAKKIGSNLGTTKVHANAEDALIDILNRTIEAGGSLEANVKPGPAGPDGKHAWAVTDDHLSPAQWAWLRQQIIHRPLWVAERVGIEKIGYLSEIKPLERIPSFHEIEEAWEQHYKKSREQKRRVMDAWRDFKKTTRVTGLRDITPEVCIAFCDNVHARKLAPKSESNMFTRLRRLFTFLKGREIAPDAMGKVVDALGRLKPSDTTVSLDPHPIEREVFHDLLEAADTEGKAMLLLMLNGAFNLVEVIRLRWSEIQKNAIVTRRLKSGRCIRVCVLWKETIDALAKLPRKGEYIFYSREGLKLTTSGADKRFRVIRTDAEVGDGVTSSHLRDGAATALAGAGIDGVTFSICMGHSSGIKDHYIKSNPAMVKPGSDAIYAAYFG